MRSLPLSQVTRQIGRPVQRIEPVSAPAAATPEPVTVPVTAPAAAPASAVRAAPVADPEKTALEKKLAERDAQIAALKAQLEKAAAEADATFMESEQRGYAAGLVKGEKEALALAKENAGRLGTLVASLDQARAQLLAAAEDDLVELAFAATCRILGEQGANRESLQRIVRSLTAGAHTPVTVRLHPDDLALLQEGAASATLSGDAAVVLGGCMVDSSSGTLDARFETQLRLLAATLTEVRASHPATERAQ